MRINKKIAVSESGFVFNPTTGDSYSLNPVAAEILDLLKKDFTVDVIRKSMFERYDVSKPILDKAIDEFIDTLIEMNIVTENE
jgi:hypothetical protein